MFGQSQRASVGRNDVLALYISPMAPLFPPELPTASSISGDVDREDDVGH